MNPDARHESTSNRLFPSRPWRNRRLVAVAFIILLLLGSFSLFGSVPATFTVTKWTTSHQNNGQSVENPERVEDSSEWEPSTVLNGPPKDKFRDNLLPNQKYITTWISAGWTNDVMTYINLIYLAKLTERIPIVAMYLPTHIGPQVPPVPFGEVFDLPRLRRELRMPVLDWSDVKSNTSQEVDELGCWNTWEVSLPNQNKPRDSFQPDILKLEISYTKAPDWIKLIPSNPNEFISFSALASLAFPETRNEYLVEPRESRYLGFKLPPDEQLLCYDYLYFVGSHVGFEFDYDFSPAWRFVGKHLHWTPRVNELADQYVRKTLGIPDGEKTPTWIAIHVRHGDFANICADYQTPNILDCFAPISVIARRVDEVKEELLHRKGIMVDHVIMTSDESDEPWWDEVRERGWYKIDHSETVALYGPWYPVFIDAAIQSGGMGFIGTDGSTMSVLARRRVESWHDGAVRTVKWGKRGADDH